MREFWNRDQELLRIKKQLGKPSLGYVTGRRRVGKTALLAKACERFGGLYHQAVEGTFRQQLLHLLEESRGLFPLLQDVTPKNWSEFLAILSREKLPPLIVLDEFPYLVQADPSLPSLLQKWIDHELPEKKCCLFVSGSSQSMLFSQFLQQNAPLYGRAQVHIDLKPMSYHWFCRVMKYDVANPESFVRFSLVGGIPHYWKLMPKGSPLEQADSLYFTPGAILSEEPIQMLRDEGITGSLPKAILDLVGRGVSKPSELASRLGVPQGNLSRPMALLLSLSLINRELPFGESSRTTKRFLYRLEDPVLAFYYGTFLPHRSRWATAMNRPERKRLLHEHASRHWENFCRSAFPGSMRYWERDIELDLVAEKADGYLIAECKWSLLKSTEEAKLIEDLKARFLRTALSRKIKEADFQIFSQKDLGPLSRSLPDEYQRKRNPIRK